MKKREIEKMLPMGKKSLQAFGRAKFLIDCIEFGEYKGFQFYSPDTKKTGSQKQGNEIYGIRNIFRHFLQFGVFEVKYYDWKSTFSYGNQYVRFIKHISEGLLELAIKVFYPNLTIIIPKNYVSFVDWTIVGEGGNDNE